MVIYRELKLFRKFIKEDEILKRYLFQQVNIDLFTIKYTTHHLDRPIHLISISSSDATIYPPEKYI